MDECGQGVDRNDDERTAVVVAIVADDEEDEKGRRNTMPTLEVEQIWLGSDCPALEARGSSLQR